MGPVHWEDFRDHLSTAERNGKRRWLYPKKPQGRWHRWRAWMSWGLIALMFAGPFVRIHGNPLLMVNIVDRRFSILGQIFWPQDMVIFAVAMLAFITGIIIFTSAFGRLWCGWTCPQTVMMEMVFRKIEYLIEGDSHAQRALDAAPLSWGKAWRKALKHGVFFGLSWLIGNTLLAYIIGSEQTLAIILDDPRHHKAGLAFMILFTLLFYGIFARFREQACAFICPYGRLQSTIIDENTMVVAYDFKRGEKRAPLRRAQAAEQRRAAGLGDCIQCSQCVSVCPAGIDIRNGTQMECVNCAACIDACDAVMDKVGSPRGLIGFSSLNSIQKGEPFRITARMKLYGALLLVLIGVFLFLVFTRSEVEMSFLRAPGSLFQITPAGAAQNLYTLKIVNKTDRDIPVNLKLDNEQGTLRLMGRESLVVPAAQLAQASALIELPLSALDGGRARLKVHVLRASDGKLIDSIDTIFLGPRGSGPSSPRLADDTTEAK